MNAFNWQGAPSQIAESLKPHRMARNQTDLEPKRLYIYAEASLSDETREAEISQVNREIEKHFAYAQSDIPDNLKAFHRGEARKLAAKVRALVLGRSDGFVAKLEQARGLS